MPSERTQRQIDRLLDAAEQAMAERDWGLVRQHVQDVLDLDPENADARDFLAAMERKAELMPSSGAGTEDTSGAPVASPATSSPGSFSSGRYTVKRFLGEGGKKKVYLAYDKNLDRDVAFALIKSEGLDDIGRQRISREGQAMGRLGSHPHIVTVFDLGEEAGQPFMVTELMGGGDVEGRVEQAPDHQLPLEQALQIADQVCAGLEYAHSHGIVHRDLKPGNVWLTAEGVAKIGDFGLAVALDRTRLTQAGMMVGTVSYMPPEQATGGEVTPRSDLYSLGAMLYEMVTGHPPFIGDENVAIIGQHLNVAPVSPTWHRHDCPPGLEALILRLLEKDPSKRPASASEVRAALQAIAAGTRVASDRTADSGTEPVPESPASGLPRTGSEDPLYRRVFVGREQELKQLQSAFDAALSGRGALAMVVGEPGIGKTSVVEQLATYAALRGGRSLVGHCYEEGSLSLPYLPFVEAMRSYVLSRDPDGLRQDLGSGSGDVARLVSEVRDRVHPEERPAGDPEEERWRLLQSVSSFLHNASLVQPLLLILEDLHDADRGTLDLLQHLARNLNGARLLVIGTYRDVEVDRAHPLSATLAELRRGQSFLRVPLRGLTVDEVARMMNAIRGQEVPWSRAEAVHRQTEGNPLFIQEVLRYLVEEGLVVRQDGRYVRADGSDDPNAGIPEGLRDVIGKRLSHLSPQANQALSIASVIGRDFRLDVLQQVAGMSEEQIDTALEEAAGRSLIEQRSALGSLGFRFTHAFFRQTLYEEIFASRRLRLHQQVARALEAVYGRRVEEHAAELAEHYAQSTDPADLAKALAYSELAAARASAVFAYGEAVRHLEQALKVQEVLDPDDRAKRCDLLLALGDALLPAGEPKRAADGVAPEALALAEQIADNERCARACVLALAGLTGATGGPGVTTTEFGQWLELADRYCLRGSAEQVRADIGFGFRETFLGRGHAGLERFQRALRHARALGDDASLCEAASLLIFTKITDLQAERRRLLDELADYPFAGVSARRLAQFLSFSGLAFLAFGERGRYERQLQRLVELAERTKDSGARLVASRQALWGLAIDGRLQELLRRAEEHLRLAEELDALEAGRSEVFFNTARPLCYLGRAEQALDAQPENARRAGAEGRSLIWAADTALVLAHLGRWAELRPYFAQLGRSLNDPDAEPDELGYSALAKFLEAAVLARDTDLAALVRPHLEPLAGMVNEHFLTTNARHLGAAAALLGEPEQAMRYYEQALEVAGKIGFRYEIALTHLGIAELLLDSGSEAERIEALQHLDIAIAELRDMKMQPALERALRHKEVLKA